MGANLSATPVAVNAAATTRIGSIDLIRGAVMILMAIDHVRVFSGVPLVARPTESSSPAG